MVKIIWFALAAGLVLVLPGAALLAWGSPFAARRPRLAAVLARTSLPAPVDSPAPVTPAAPDSNHPDFLCRLADAIALSLALPALLAQWLFVAGLTLPPQGIIALYALALLAGLVGLARRLGLVRLAPRWLAGWLTRRDGGLQVLAGLALVAALLAWRLLQAKDLALPPWVDSVHHALVVQLILSAGGLPENYLPYFDAPFFYHYGYHLSAALLAFFSRLPIEQVMLWGGQLINAAVSLSVYRAAYALGDDQRPTLRAGRAVLAAALVTLAFHMPAYYLTWGRYTMLSGLVLLGPAMAAALEIWRAPAQRAAWLRLALLVAGLSLTHYFILLLLALFLVGLGLMAVARWVLDGRLRVALWLLLACSLAGLLLAAPWLARVYEYERRSANVRVIDPLDQSEAAVRRSADYFKYLETLLGPRRNHIVLGLSALGLLAGLRRPGLRPLLIWTLLLVLFSLPWGLRLGPFRPDHFAIVLFFPAGILLAELLLAGALALQSLPGLAGRAAAVPSDAPVNHTPGNPAAADEQAAAEEQPAADERPANQPPAHLPPARRPQALSLAALLLAAGGLLGWGMRETSSIINPVTLIANQADLTALNWVRRATPPEARFYINTIGWMGNTPRGVDGGYWLAPYTGRASLLPPALFIWSPPEDVQRILDWAARAQQVTGCDQAFWAIVEEAGLTHVYLRQGVGKLQPASLQNCQRLGLAYEYDGVYIYEIRPNP